MLVRNYNKKTVNREENQKEVLLLTVWFPPLYTYRLKILFRSIQADSEALGNSAKPVNLKNPLPVSLLHDNSTPDYLGELAEQTGLSPNSLLFEIDENVVVTTPELATDVLSLLKIKGFKLVVCVKENIDQVLARLDKLPIDELTLDLAARKFRDGKTEDSETEFQIDTLVSVVLKEDMNVSVKNLFNAQQR
jgi:EAL domain-containing protein (putative c-di-GMP-specific phosphodiesterase class I)